MLFLIMQNYELTIVLPENATAANKKSAKKLVEKLIKTYEGKMEKDDDWGKKEFFYQIKGEDAGVFLHFLLQLNSDKINPLRENLKMQDELIRSLLIKVEDL